MILNPEEEDAIIPTPEVTFSKRYKVNTPYSLTYAMGLSNIKNMTVLGLAPTDTDYWKLFKPDPLLDEYESDFSIVKTGLFHFSVSFQFTTPAATTSPQNVEATLFHQRNGVITPLAASRLQTLDFLVSTPYILTLSSFIKANDGDRIFVKVINVLNQGNIGVPAYSNPYFNVGTLITVTLIK